jgi:hypothetical protein
MNGKLRMIKPIGGELALQKLNENLYFTDSGRSSLKLFIRSGNKDKKFLIPNFLCSVIEDVLKEENVEFEYYHIKEDLSIDKKSVLEKKFDIFYLINYFGEFIDSDGLNLDDKIVMEDNVFFYDFENRFNFKKWYGFNSFRKISSLADGSLVKTNLKISEDLINSSSAKFVENKYKAKNIKFNYLNCYKGEEREYLNLFEKGEEIINSQKEIFKISSESIYYLMQYELNKEQIVSKKFYEMLYKEFESFCLNKNPSFYSFFVMKVEKRDELRKFLFSKNIFLPVHWPGDKVKNPLYGEIISIPLFSAYSEKDIKYIISSIKEFYEKN